MDKLSETRKIRQVGIGLHSLENHQKVFEAINFANTVNSTDLYSVSFFCYELINPVIDVMGAVDMIDNLTLVRDLVIVTDIQTCKILPECRATHKVLYLYDLEWLRKPSDYIENIKILKNNLVITRSKEYADIIHNYCGVSAYVVENFNIAGIANVCER